MIVKTTNVVKKIVILLHLGGMLVVHICGRFIKLMLICLAAKCVWLKIMPINKLKQCLKYRVVVCVKIKYSLLPINFFDI